MAEPVRARRLTDEEGRRLQQIVRRGKHESIRVRRALIIMASASGTPVPAIARLVAAHEDTVRNVIRRFNEIGLRALDPNWAGGRPRRISADDEAFIVATATARPTKLGLPFTHWSLRKLAGHLATNPTRRVVIGRERLRQLLRHNDISLQRTRTWKEFTDRARSPWPTPNHPNHTVLAHELQAYLRWRNANARHPDVLAAQRRERARIRSERQQRWGRPATTARAA